jgi:transketolase
MKRQNLRDAFWDTVYEAAKENRNVYVVSADLGAISLDRFRLNLPAQFINVGISEQNAVTVAAGLALAGKKVYVYANAPFIALRCYEQIRVAVCSMNLPVTVVGQGAGFSFWEFGPTHHIVEDIGAMRMLPHMTMYNLSDTVMTRVIARESVTSRGAQYIRVDKLAPPDLYESEAQVDYPAGFALHGKGGEALLIGTGNTAFMVAEACSALKARGVDAAWMDLYSMRPDAARLLETLARFPVIVSVEEHAYACGMGSLLCEMVNDAGLLKLIRRIAVDTVDGYHYQYGSRESIQESYGLSVENIVRQVTDAR